MDVLLTVCFSYSTTDSIPTALDTISGWDICLLKFKVPSILNTTDNVGVFRPTDYNIRTWMLRRLLDIFHERRRSSVLAVDQLNVMDQQCMDHT